DHPDFASIAQRMTNLEKTVALVQAFMQTKTVSEWLSCQSAAGIPCSPINTLGQALAHPQVAARGLVVESNHPVLGALKTIAHPVRCEQQDRSACDPRPLQGEHSEQVLLEAGYSQEYIQSLTDQGIITKPSRS